MNNTANESNTPWYKQFWPWFLISLPGSVVIASIVTIFIAAHNPDTIVVDDYYKQGLAINQDITRDRLAVQLGITAVMKLVDNKVIITLSATEKVNPDYLVLRMMHPTLANKDQQMKLEQISPMTYSTKIPTVSSGDWNLRLEGNNPDWRIQKRLKISDDNRQYSLP